MEGNNVLKTTTNFKGLQNSARKLKNMVAGFIVMRGVPQGTTLESIVNTSLKVF